MQIIEFKVAETVPMFREWLSKYALSQEGLDEFAEILDKLIEFKGLAVAFELIDGRLFKTLLSMLYSEGTKESEE